MLVGDRSDVNLSGSGQLSTVSADEVAQAPVVQAKHDFETVYATLWPEMVRVGRLMTGSQAAGEEVAQDAFVGLYRHFDRVDPTAAFVRRSVANGARTAVAGNTTRWPLNTTPPRPRPRPTKPGKHCTS